MKFYKICTKLYYGGYKYALLLAFVNMQWSSVRQDDSMVSRGLNDRDYNFTLLCVKYCSILQWNAPFQKQKNLHWFSKSEC